MLEESTLINLTALKFTGESTSHLRQEYEACRNLFLKQPALVQQFLAVQAASLGSMLIEGLPSTRFTLPDRVVISDGEGEQEVQISEQEREQLVGGLTSRLARGDLQARLQQRFSDLESSTNMAVATGSLLLRQALVVHLVYNTLPSGRTVLYKKQPWDEIPSLPVHRDEKEQRQSTASGQDHGRGLSDEKFQQEQAVPYVEAARDFFLPQWVAFDSEGKLLVRSVNEAEAHLQSMSRFLSILHTAAELAPYIVADEEYQRKRYGISGQLLNQGRALADYAVDEMIRKIKTRAADHDLDRGLSLSVPYFDDQTMTLEVCPFDVIPVGRVMFVPAFIVLAVRSQGAKVAQDIRFNKSTRRHLLMELSKLEEAFLR